MEEKIELVKLIEDVINEIAEAKRVYRKAVRSLEDVEEKLNKIVEKV